MAATLLRVGMIAPLRPDRYVRMVLALRRYGANPMTSVSLAAARAPAATAIVDERGSITWRELERTSDALAVAFTGLTDPRPRTIGILCRNHRGFVQTLTASAKAGADALLLNTGFSGRQLAEVLQREGAQVLVYDEEFAGWSRRPARASTGWSRCSAGSTSRRPVGPGRRARRDPPRPPRQAGPRRARDPADLRDDRHPQGRPPRGGGGGTGALAAMFDRIPWRARETTVVAAPMFHAWGFGQLAVSATMTCTVVTRRRFDPEATLRMVEEHDATGLAVVPVMLERIMDLGPEVLDRYRLPSLRFATASGSRMRPDAVLGFMDRFGDVVYNSYNATEAGLITTAVPADLRAEPETAGRPVRGTRLRILDDADRELPPGEVGRIVVLSGSTFEGYTSGDTKDFHEDFMVSGDVGRLDDAGRLFVVGPRRRDDRLRRRERLPARGRADPGRARRRARGLGDRSRRRPVRPAPRRLRRTAPGRGGRRGRAEGHT